MKKKKKAIDNALGFMDLDWTLELRTSGQKGLGNEWEQSRVCLYQIFFFTCTEVTTKNITQKILLGLIFTGVGKFKGIFQMSRLNWPSLKNS